MDLKELEKSILTLDDYPIDDWNPKICEGVEFSIDTDANWFFNGSKIDRPAMVKLFSKLVKLSEKNKLTVEMIDNQPYPKIKLKNDIFALLSRNVFYKVIAESKQDGMSMYLESDGKFFYLN